ncbi:MAG: phage antirepressor N-terminal domain-containing protein [Desulfovibrio sp.]|uniref:phage antirepressor N-terminal domain-containing protein n=1 Tax=Desulfovibrio sp. TaxID=885 RepID=UPI002A908D5B|nr:phage antirepressor N-terminal domain-containing protein [Desulfovibrio sp.]MDY6234078.1 phage antirepressor N-terminal domain-containing protein [Desulfovibrio sp.]
MCQLSPVTFHGDTIFCIDYQNQPFTPMKPIVQNMGLDWSGQAAKLNANKERWGVSIIEIPSNGGEQEMLCMPIRKLPSYLNSINPRKVRPELRAKIELYQAESDDALWNYWMHGRAERPAPQPQPTTDGPLTPALRAELKAIVDAKLSTAPADVQGKARAEIWTRFNRHFKIAEYAQLPACRMAEARDYLIEMEMKSYPTKTSAAVPANAEQEIETHCAAMRGLVRQLNAHMDEIFNIARKSKPDLRTPGERRELALSSIYTMEDAAGAIGHNIAVLERTAKTTLIAARM